MNYASAMNTYRKEDIGIAPYGIHSSNSKGRRFPEADHDYRSCFQRDKDRIIHTTAFRRLEYKTQVFINDEGDYYRTRLTHTLEVVQIGRTLARALGGNEDLVEAICLAHDMGHPPFGHAGESTLAKIMSDHGSFNHNRHTMRIVTLLEQRYPDFDGLNLCYETLEGIAKHETEYDIMDVQEFSPDLRGHLEAQIANVSDEIAYGSHDLDDGLRSGMLTADMCQDLLIWKLIADDLHWVGPHLSDLDRHRFIRQLTNLEVTDAFYTAQEKISSSKIKSVDDLQRLPYNVVVNSSLWLSQNRELKDFLFHRLYRHYRVVRMSLKAEMIISRLFEAFLKEPSLLPNHIQKNIEERGREVAICDYIAGMTDRYAIDQYNKLFEPSLLP